MFKALIPSRRIVSLSLAVFALPAVAAEGRIPIPFSSPVTTPIIIGQSGSYVLTRNLSATGVGAILAIVTGADTPNVELDLNGFTLNNSANPTFPVVQVGIVDGLTIRNGTLLGGNRGIIANATSSRIVIEDVKIANSTLDGIFLFDSRNFAVRRCVIVDTGSVGIRLQTNMALMQGTIEQNLIRNCKDGIAALDGVAVAVRDNRLETIAAGGPYGAGIHISNCATALVVENTILTVAGGTGIRLANTRASSLIHNVISGCGVHGILVDTPSNDNLILRNVVTGSTGSGLHVAGDRNHIEANVLNLNGRGLTLDLPSLNNLYRANMARGNTGVFACPGGLCSADFCGFGVPMNNTQGDNFLPATAVAPPVCEK